MTATHTPGPWIYSVENGETLLANGNIVIASFQDGNEPCEADARLIAQAPAMLERYRLIANCDCVKGDPPGDMARICQAAPCDPCFARAILRAVEG